MPCEAEDENVFLPTSVAGSMPAKALYVEDSYLRECDSTVTSVKDGKFVVLDQTIFYPKSGGVLHDTGTIFRGEESFPVVYVGKFSGEISHEVGAEGLQEGNRVRCCLDWDRRYKLMRSHTAAHAMISVLCQETGALVTGNDVGLDRTRFDFSLDSFDRQVLLSYIDRANELFQKDVPVDTYELPREEAMKIPGVVKLAAALPPKVERLRIVEIKGVDRQADGGCHVRNLNEVGRAEFIKAENKGKNNRRVYYRLTE
jgi:misacylated tRNA(Ala) deacylase